MRQQYEKPMLLENEDFSEGVYMSSGSGSGASSSCYSASGSIIGTPSDGMDYYTIQVTGSHSAKHSNNIQTVTISFNQAVTYVYSSASNYSGSGTSKLVLTFYYKLKGDDTFYLDDLQVKSEPGLLITGVTVADRH